MTSQTGMQVATNAYYPYCAYFQELKANSQ